MDWMMSPIVPLALFVALTGCLLAFYVSVKREIAALSRRALELEDKLASSFEAQHALFRHLAEDVQELRDLPRPAPAAAISMNLTRRYQVLRMASRGESAAQIAATLHIPRREVELLLKMKEHTPAGFP